MQVSNQVQHPVSSAHTVRRSLSTFSARNILESMVLEASKLLDACSTTLRVSVSGSWHSQTPTTPPFFIFSLTRQASVWSCTHFETVLRAVRTALSLRWRSPLISQTPPTGWTLLCHFLHRWNLHYDARFARISMIPLSSLLARIPSAHCAFAAVLARKENVRSAAARIKSSSSVATGSCRSLSSSS